ncbi:MULTISPECIES: bifunctional aspartate kinase/homoserine dehydrogenase I [unclassified Imperialibacter]|uniref:bifunctional aspartate kinase/homoserine dehydrogenase I n=1 Tax=unclassified Imperialibacter TaxID=2629706 RepID=UPI00125367E3|nr:MULTISPECIES: bifunctional aspartate kinase/homoserine dehydrogenase I [unclassified Imperialibacter]CAD5271503.1 Bifunctional aspartokinase I/homoserine dehydrogenase I [Imperialibacter sp. 89]CAD5298860.1 Bifunctional aspartokinase I/homoserine dehydrogenase I [Imperialibacter sp. 75]VVT35080.1 Bifunctional aspartokinase I/homoserine dehydrogenase I [Imperialibacter sp. EC-SDR9]
MKVLKFGGTSVGSSENIRKVAAILQDYQKQGTEVAVVVSAMSGVTNRLIALGDVAVSGDESYLVDLERLRLLHLDTMKRLNDNKLHPEGRDTIDKLFAELKDMLHGVFLIKELSVRSLDLIQSFGERLSANIITLYLQKTGINAAFLDTRRVIRTDNHFGSSKVNFKETNALVKGFFEGNKSMVVATGFIASTAQNETTTLGRGGSDYTASILAAALDADEVEIWTDVDGVMTADPRKVREAYSMTSLSYVEAMEMSHFGAKVIYPPTLQPAISKKIPLRIRNTFNPAFEGTLITQQSTGKKYPVKGISSIENMSLVSLIGGGIAGVPGVASRLFGALARKNVNIVLITQASSEHSITFAVSPKDGTIARDVLKEEFAQEIKNREIDRIQAEEDLSIVAVIGENMKNTPGIAGKLFQAFGRNGINVVAIAQGSSELNVSVVINRANISKALNSLHETFFLSDRKSLNVFLVGTGLIGSTLIEQIKAQAAYLMEERSLKINLVGIANSRHMVFDEGGIDLNTWRKLVDKPGKGIELSAFIEKMESMNLANSVFIDCTSSAKVIEFYEDILESSISIVTPNKLANSGPLAFYEKLKKQAAKHGVKFMYETNVGAGLPVINTLNDLKYSGDKIIKIEGILSGTLSYIFNSFKEGVPFSQVVTEARSKGLTEPDPRDDLNGMDVARKILILGREAGQKLDIKDVKLEPILSDACFKAPNIDVFFEELKKEDGRLEAMRKKAMDEGKKLRFIAKVEEGKASISLQAVDAEHPFYSLSGSDNIISFTTQRYFERPLVVKGPGAGAEVTSAGVFAEIISISNHFIQDNYKFAGGYGG